MDITHSLLYYLVKQVQRCVLFYIKHLLYNGRGECLCVFVFKAVNLPSHGVISQGSTLRGPVAVALRLCPILGHR